MCICVCVGEGGGLGGNWEMVAGNRERILDWRQG